MAKGIQRHTLELTNAEGETATFELNNLDGEKGGEIFFQLVSLMGEPVGHLGANVRSFVKAEPKAPAEDEEPKEVQDDGALEEQDEGEGPDRKGVALALGALFKSIGSPTSMKIIKALLNGLRRDKQPVIFKTYFAGNYGELMQLTMWALEINYASFFAGNQFLRGLMERARTLNLPPT